MFTLVQCELSTIAVQVEQRRAQKGGKMELNCSRWEQYVVIWHAITTKGHFT